MGVLFHIFPIVAALLYLLASAFYAAELFFGRQLGGVVGRKLLVVGVMLHSVSLLGIQMAMIWSSDAARFGGVSAGAVASFPYSLSLISCLLVGCFLLLDRRMGVSMLGAFVSPLAAGFMLFSGILFHVKRGEPEAIAGDPLLAFHIACTVLGHVAFVFAFGVSIALIIQESLLKSRRFGLLQRKLPSLQVLDRLNVRFLGGGFVLMVCGIGAGVIFGVVNGISFLGFNPRIVWSILTLLVYALLLSARAATGLRGRRAAWLSVAGFCCVVASFVGVNLAGAGFHVH